MWRGDDHKLQQRCGCCVRKCARPSVCCRVFARLHACPSYTTEHLPAVAAERLCLSFCCKTGCLAVLSGHQLDSVLPVPYCLLLALQHLLRLQASVITSQQTEQVLQGSSKQQGMSSTLSSCCPELVTCHLTTDTLLLLMLLPSSLLQSQLVRAATAGAAVHCAPRCCCDQGQTAFCFSERTIKCFYSQLLHVSGSIRQDHCKATTLLAGTCLKLPSSCAAVADVLPYMLGCCCFALYNHQNFFIS